MWRTRPAFDALKRWITDLGESTFVSRVVHESVDVYEFRRAGGDAVYVVYSTESVANWMPTFEFDRAINMVTGGEVSGGAALSIGAEPVLLT